MMDHNSAAGINPELQQRMQEAAALSDDDRWDEAFEILREQEEHHPADATLLCMLGSAAHELGAFDEGYQYFRRSLAQEPQDPVVLVTAGVALARYDDPEAERALRLAALTAPNLAFARMHYGAYLAREGMIGEAVAELEAAHRLDPGEPGVDRELGIAYLLAGRDDDGLQRLEEAVAEPREGPETRVLLGLALLLAERGEQAAEELHRASVELTADADVQLLAALACAGQGWEDEAWNALARAEAAGTISDPEIVREAEEAIETGAEAAEALLHEQLAPSILRERMAERL